MYHRTSGCSWEFLDILIMIMLHSRRIWSWYRLSAFQSLIHDAFAVLLRYIDWNHFGYQIDAFCIAHSSKTRFYDIAGTVHMTYSRCVLSWWCSTKLQSYPESPMFGELSIKVKRNIQNCFFCHSASFVLYSISLLSLFRRSYTPMLSLFCHYRRWCLLLQLVWGAGW